MMREAIRRGVVGVVAAVLAVGWTALVAVPAGAQEPQEVAVRVAINPGLGGPPPQVLRSSPAAVWRSLLQLGAEGQYAAAAHLLDLSEVPVDQQRAVGEEVARKLYEVLDRLGAGIDQVTDDDPVGPRRGETALNVVVALRFQRPAMSGEVWLRRTRDDESGELAWLVTRKTVSSVRLWHEVLVEGKGVAVGGELNSGLGPAPPGVRRGSPRETLTGFLAAARSGGFDVAAHYLDLDGIEADRQPEEGRRLARRLMLAMQRRLWIDPAQVSNDAGGAPQAGVPSDRQRLAVVEVDGREVDVMLQRRTDPSGAFAWLFAPELVGEIDAVYEAHGYGWLGDHLPAAFFAVSFLGLQLWQWSALLLIIVVGWVVARVAGHVIVLVALSFAGRTAVSWDDEVVRALDGPLGFVLWGLLLAVASPLVGLTPGAQAVSTRAWKLLVIVGLGWLLFRALEGVGRQLRVAASERNAVALTFIPIAQRIAKFIVLLILVLAALDVVGVNVVAALAGLGLGGLAVAFAAQKTLENIFGALAIAADRPFTVGDFVTVGGIAGTIEDVGLRSTRIRTLERTVVTIPNSAVVNDTIVNLTVRDRILYNPTIGVVYGTTAAQLTFIVDEIRRILLEDPRIYLDAQRTRFKAFGASSLDIEVMAWVLTSDYTRYTAIAEELNLKIMEIVERAGSSFAFPSQTLYLARDEGLDAGRAEEVARMVGERRERGELVVPEPTEEQLAEIRARRQGDGEGE